MTPPVVLALLAADRVARNRSDGRCDLFGIFHALNARLPHRLTFAVYYVLTGCHGPVDVDVQFLDPTDRVIGAGPVRIPASDPLAIVQGIGSFDVTLTAVGTYRVRATCAGVVLAETAVIVAESQPL